jgi:methyl-accepting chemotaxis protein
MMMRKSAVEKLVWGAIGVVALSLIMGVGSMVTTGWLGRELDRTVNQITRQQMLAGQISTAAADMMAQARGLAFATVLQQSDQARQAQGGYESAESRLQGLLGEYQKLADVPPQVKVLKEKSAVAHKSYEGLVEKLAQTKMDEALQMLNSELLPSLTGVAGTSKQLVEHQNRLLAGVRSSAGDAQQRSQLANVALLGACAVLGTFVVLTSRKVQRQLTATVRALSEEAKQLTNAAGHVSSTSQSLAEMVTSQAASIDSAAMSTSEIRNKTQQNAENARSAAQRTDDSYTRIQETNAALRDMLTAMSEIGASSKKISGVIKVIDGIAFQTNILSLNASVEAARAGAAGLGFAVVADEVRGLAQRSADAARDTSALIEESLQRSKQGKDKADEMARSIESVTGSARAVKSLVEEVRESCQTQESGIQQMVGAVNEMRSLAQRLSAHAQEGMAAGQQLAGQAQSVRSVVNSLEDLVGRAG